MYIYYVYINTYIYIITMKKGHEFESSKEECMGGKGKEK